METGCLWLQGWLWPQMLPLVQPRANGCSGCHPACAFCAGQHNCSAWTSCSTASQWTPWPEWFTGKPWQCQPTHSCRCALHQAVRNSACMKFALVVCWVRCNMLQFKCSPAALSQDSRQHRLRSSGSSVACHTIHPPCVLPCVLPFVRAESLAAPHL